MEKKEDGDDIYSEVDYMVTWKVWKNKIVKIYNYLIVDMVLKYLTIIKKSLIHFS